jgi:hypothetical protein
MSFVSLLLLQAVRVRAITSARAGKNSFFINAFLLQVSYMLYSQPAKTGLLMPNVIYGYLEHILGAQLSG